MIVLGQTPQHSSAMVMALLDLIRPVPFAGVVRPYVPMQSTGLGGDVAIFDPPTHLSFITGITNPFLLQRYSNVAPEMVPYILALTSPISPSHDSSLSSHEPKSSHLNHSRSIRSRRVLASHASVSKKIDVPGTPIRSQARPSHYIKMNHSFINTLSVPDEHGASGPALNIRRHFTDVTARLLAPINRHLATISTARAASAPPSEKFVAGAASIRTSSPSSSGGAASSSFLASEFQLPAFLTSLAKQESPVAFVGQMSHGRHKARDAFYTKFCSSANFKAWLEINAATERQLVAGVFD